MRRKPISKKLRFEVFKRDSFTCQYCGRMAPDVILEVDHINPVANGGDNNILNLITSCFDCNRGKGKKRLTQNDEIKKTQEMLKTINEKREQLEMLLKWKKELENIDNNMVDEIEKILSITGNTFSDYGRKECVKLIKKYGFSEVYESAKLSLEQYYDEEDKESATKVFNYIGRICSVRERQKNDPLLYQINYLCKIAKNRLSYCDEYRLKIYLKERFNEEDFDILKDMFCRCKNWTDLKNKLYYYYDEVE